MADTLVKFRIRRGTAAQWAAVNPVLLSAEPGFETDTKILRMGDGVTAFTALKRYPALEDINSDFIGLIGMFPTTTAPAGWLKANGAAVSRTAYAALFSRIGTVSGAGNGTTTFNLPDLRAEFLRGLDDGRGVDTGRALGSAQAFAVQTPVMANGGTFKAFFVSTSRTGNFASSVDAINSISESGPLGNFSDPIGAVETSSISRATIALASETRPRNVALLACIKF